MDHTEELEQLSGTVAAVIFSNMENGYGVVRLRDEDISPDMPIEPDGHIICAGRIPVAAAGLDIVCEGNWVEDSRYGMQFRVENSYTMEPMTENAIFEYLSGGVIKGIGPATASLIVNEFGRESLEILEEDPERLAKIKGITASKARAWSESYKQITVMRRLIEFLSDKRVRTMVAIRLYRYYGDSAMEIVQRDPYIVAASHVGGTFGEADGLAISLGFEQDSHERIRAACCYELTFNLNNGHCFIPYKTLVSSAAGLIGVDPERVPECLDELAAEERIIVDKSEAIGEDNWPCYLPELYEAETYVADRLAAMNKKPIKPVFDPEPAIDMIEKENRITYAPEQRETLRKSLSSRIMIITGGPGTGKTTTVRGIISLYEMAGIKYLLAAPTGRAAKRMTELSGREAATVHRLLGAKKDDEGFMTVYSKNEEDPLNCEAIILDETSMVDVLLMSALLKAMPENARLICVGDKDQLPPVGPGRVFTAMINSGVFPTVRLNEVFRQSGGSMIVKNAHLINNGILPDFSANKGDFFRLKRLEGASSIETVTELCASRLPEKMKIPVEEIQVLTPSRKGELGSVNLNRELQKLLNPQTPEKTEKSFGETVFREGDRVMQVRNNYDITWHDESVGIAGAGIYNGDIGYIRSIDPMAESMLIDFDGRIALYSFSWLSELEHAWAITVHKSQGCEFRAVILALSTFSKRLLTRSILYTAVTRARDILILIGSDETARTMIDNSTVVPRYSFLRQKILKGMGCM
ncbi:MAG: ATP-dependent RecD-like DNA helicase [Eubacteriales bacterium]|nr:ATP-dependent RecD-like DNA helicase [Eubacteriales bacterium]